MRFLYRKISVYSAVTDIAHPFQISSLREQINQSERGDKTLLRDYQLQVEQLHADLTSLKRHYEKMRQKHQKEKIRLSRQVWGKR